MRDDEPNWMSRVRRVRSGEDIVINTDDISADKMSAQQLALIGRGAIGGYREDELRRESSNDENSATAAAESSSDSQDARRTLRAGLLNTRTERDLEKAEGFGDEYNEKQGDGDEQHWQCIGAQEGMQRHGRHRRLEGSDEDSNPAADYLGDDCVEMRRLSRAV